jgi:selenocysteine lyase/cysteine desulfurase
MTPDDFFDFDGWTYLNCAYHGPMPRVAKEALDVAVALRANPGLMRNEYHFAFPDAYRRAVGALVGADPSTISLTDSATAGAMVVANGLDWRAGDEVVIPRGEFPSNRLPFQQLAARGVTVREVDLGDGPTPEEALVDALSRKTRVLAASWVGFSDGRRLDLAALGRACRDRGVLFVVDGSQGIGGLPFDLGRTPCDVLISAGYKWLLGPYGLGFVRVEPELAARLEIRNANWFASRGAEDFNRLADLPFDPVAGGRRFDMNEPASFFNVAAGIASARYVASVTPGAVEAHCRTLNDRIAAGLPPGFAALGLDAPLRSNILCFTGPDETATARALERLRARRIAVSARENAIRVSPHVYNTVADVDTLLACVEDAAAAGPDGPFPGPDGPGLHRAVRLLLGLPDEN